MATRGDIAAEVERVDHAAEGGEVRDERGEERQDNQHCNTDRNIVPCKRLYFVNSGRVIGPISIGKVRPALI